MLFHASIPADDPERVARVIAELWRGSVTSFPPCPGAFMAWANDERRTVIDKFPRGTQHVPAPGQFGLRAAADPSPHSEAHLALAARVSADEILAIANARAGSRSVRSAADCSPSSSSGSRTSFCSSCCPSRTSSATAKT